MTQSITTLVLAGSRPGTDPLLEGTTLASKALLPIHGKPMLAWVIDALSNSPEVGRVQIVAQEIEPLARHATLATWGKVEWVKSVGSIADAVQAALAQSNGPLLVTTADNVLLTPQMVAQFLADAGSSDVAIGLVERSQVVAAGHSTQRTWLKFRGGHWSGANLFMLGGPQVGPLVEFWRGIEQDRKKGWKIIGTFGPLLLLAAVFRLIDIHAFARRVAARFGMSAKVVSMAAAEACIDADKPSDIRVIERILDARQAATSAASTASSASRNSSS